MSGKQPEQWYVGRHEQLWGMQPEQRNAVQKIFFEIAEDVRSGREAFEPIITSQRGVRTRASIGTHRVQLTDHFKGCACVDLGRDGKGRPLGDSKLSPPREDIDLSLPHDPWIGAAKYLTEFKPGRRDGGDALKGPPARHVHIYKFDEEAGLFSCTYEGCGRHHLPEEES